MTPPPPLPYAPRRQSPLSLWNPLDYLVLLYWGFLFPQALRWYVETFSSLPADTDARQAVRQDISQRRLALQGMILILGIAFASELFGFLLHVRAAMLGVGLTVGGAGGAMLVGGARGVAGRTVSALLGGVIFGIVDMALGIVGTIRVWPKGTIPFNVGEVAVSLVLGLGVGIIYGMLLVGTIVGVAVSSGVRGGVADGMARGVARRLLGWILFGVGSGSYYVLILEMLKDRADQLTTQLTTQLTIFLLIAPLASLICILSALRADTFVLALLPSLFHRSHYMAITLQRWSCIPIYRLRWRLVQRLGEDWIGGLRECEGLLRYSLQFIPVIVAIQQMLERTPLSELLPRLASWCSAPLYDWRVVLFQSASLRRTMLREFCAGLFIVPRRWRPTVAATVRSDTPVRAACAGFWFLQQGDAAQASQAFASLSHVPYGEELRANADALAKAFGSTSLAAISDWTPPAKTRDELLRPQVQALFERLALIAQDVGLVLRSHSARQRNSALNRASGALNDFPAHLGDCPTPERLLFVRITAQWLSIVLASASAVGKLEVRQLVASPYIVGAPVPADRLVGREDVFAQIQAMWDKSGQRDSLVIFGHRRMGKSSVVKNLLHFCPFHQDTALAVLNLQSVDWEQGMNDLCYAIAFELWREAPTSVEEPQPPAYGQQPLTTLRRLLDSLGRSGGERRYILMLDEYELLDQRLPPAAARDFLTMLRGWTQQYPWLVMALVGLHSLEERSANFYEAIYTWRRIKLGLLGPDAVADMLQVEDDSFPLEYTPEATVWAHQLTGGQPFLIQLLGDSLVRRYNQQLRQQLDPPSAMFSVDDVDAVVADPQFYEEGTAYFRGIWDQAGHTPQGQQAVLRALASHADGVQSTRLQQVSGLDSDVFPGTLEALCRHDVVVCHEGLCRYTVELMRRWVEAGNVPSRSEGHGL